MAVHSPAVSKRLLNILRVTFLMMRKGLVSKRKLIMDMNLMMKRGKLLRKTFSNLMSTQQHTARGSFGIQEYEFSCSNSPNPVFFHLPSKRNKHHYFPCINPPNVEEEEEERAQELAKAVALVPKTPEYIISAQNHKSPLLSPFSVRVSNYSSEEIEETVEGGNGQVDDQAEEFIRRFYEQLKVQSRVQLLHVNHPKTHKPYAFRTISILPNFQSFNSHQAHILSHKIPHIPRNQAPKLHSIKPINTNIPNSLERHLLSPQNTYFSHIYGKQSIPFILLEFFTVFPCFASETVVPTEQVTQKINLEAILVSIDEFFNRNPFFVSGVTFIWLVVIPLTQEYLKKYKFISAINAFRKLRDSPNSQLLDIRDKKSLIYLSSPNLKILNKGVVQVQFSEGEDEEFVKKVMENFADPEKTTVCVLDNFDGNSIKVAELLIKNGFKEAYAIRGGVRGKDGWQEIQENLLPPSVHIYPKKKVKISQQLEMNGGINKGSEHNSEDESKRMDNGYVKKMAKLDSRPSSPYTNYPDLKPPSSPTPSKPRN